MLNNMLQAVEAYQEDILAAERHIWKNPEPGYREWKTHAYLKEKFEGLGYAVTEAGNIPGFWTDLDTGRPGPCIAVFGELDSLIVPTHPECDPETGAVHACGHHCQSAALLGVAAALKAPGALDNLSGSIRLIAVPAEELIELGFRKQLKEQGIIRYFGGKVEFLYRGYMDGCDIAFMNHATTKTDYIFDCNDSNGCMAKEATYAGVAAHAGGSPHLGVNALYAATQGLNAINALRETFQDGEHVRVHPIMTAGGGSVNIIPAEAKISTFVRGATLESMVESNRKVNRALASGALALGATVKISDRPGYAPLLNDRGLMQVAEDVAVMLLGKDKVQMHRPWGCGSTDMGDLSCVMRALHPHISGASGKGHGDDYYITDPETCCVMGAAIQVTLAAALLENGAARAKEVLAGPALRYPNKEAYFEAMDQFMADRELVTYDGDKAIVEF